MNKNNILLQHHAHLWIGNKSKLEETVIATLQKTLCKKNGCQECQICILITQHQHPEIFWIEPDGSYTLDQIDEILNHVKFKLNSTEHRFFIFTQADQLSANCNNRLLKTIEEPHAGYFFIFLTSRTDTILPTLISRCFIQQIHSDLIDYTHQEIMQPFIQNNFTQPLDFIKSIEKHEIKEAETKDIVDDLIAYFHNQLIQIHSKDMLNKSEIMIKTTTKIVILKNALSKLPASGSAKMFWKNLYLTFHEQQ